MHVCACMGTKHTSICVQPQCNKKEVDADWESFSGENKEGESERGMGGWRAGGNVAVEGASELTLRMASLR